jgi:hypothetical protein
LYLTQLTVSASYSLYIWESSMHASVITESSGFGRLVAMTDGGLGQDAAQMKLDVLSAMHFIAEAW